MAQANVISINAFRKVRETESEEFEYRAKILGMDKLELLEEMVRFQEERTQAGQLSIGMISKGRHLFKALEESAETNELKLLTRSYRRHLEHEMLEYLKQNPRA